METKAVGLLEQYDVEVIRTRKGRGAILCDTDRGCLIFKEYSGNEQRAALQNLLLEKLHEDGKVMAERILPNKEGQLFVKDQDGTAYFLKTWVEGRECSSFDRGECVEAARLLATLHNSMEKVEPDTCLSVFRPAEEYEKRNRELKKVRQFLRTKSQKNEFEISLQQAFESFWQQAGEVSKQWESYSHLSEKQPECHCLCHGDYQYHNIIRKDNGWYLINFEKYTRDNPIRDLYLLLRKLLEKSDWSVSLGNELIRAYEEVRPISAYSRIDLYYRLAYPEKFWKIENFYYTTRKVWIPERNQEKLDKLLRQEPQKEHFLETVFGI